MAARGTSEKRARGVSRRARRFAAACGCIPCRARRAGGRARRGVGVADILSIEEETHAPRFADRARGLGQPQHAVLAVRDVDANEQGAADDEDAVHALVEEDLEKLPWTGRLSFISRNLKVANAGS